MLYLKQIRFFNKKYEFTRVSGQEILQNNDVPIQRGRVASSVSEAFLSQ